MRCRRIKQWLGDDNQQHTEVVWFGSYGVSGDQSALFFNPEDKHDNFSDKQQAVVDSLTQRLSVLKNELWYKVSYGLPLFDKVKSKLMIDAVVLSIISDHPDVSQVQQFQSKVQDHNYHFSATILSTFGQLLLQS